MFAEDFWECAAMSSDPQKFAAGVLAAFRAAGHYTDQEIGEAGGPSTTSLTKLRKVAEDGGLMPSPRSDTLRKIDQAAGWVSGSARALWETGTAPVVSPNSGLRAVLGLPDPTPEEVRDSRRKRLTVGGIDDYIEALADRVLELEERLDILDQELGRSVSAPADTLPAVANDGDIEDSGENSI